MASRLISPPSREKSFRQHYAFLVDDAGFDHGMKRIKALGLDYWADPARNRPGEINRNDGGRGVSFRPRRAHARTDHQTLRQRLIASALQSRHVPLRAAGAAMRVTAMFAMGGKWSFAQIVMLNSFGVTRSKGLQTAPIGR